MSRKPRLDYAPLLAAAIARGLAAVEIRLPDVRWVTVPFDVGT
jgi:hypothetical protein